MAGLQLICATASAFMVKQGGAQSQPGGGQGCFDAGMAGADDDHVEFVGQCEHRVSVRAALVAHSGAAQCSAAQ